LTKPISGGLQEFRKRSIRTFSNDAEFVRKRREHIADKALDVFLDKGYGNTTMRDLYKACGMSPGGLYHYINSKSDIIHLICMNYEPMAAGLVAFQNSLGNVSYARVLHDAIVFCIKRCDSQSRTLVFIHREIRNFDPEDRRLLLNPDVGSFFEQLLREGIEAGEFQTCEPDFIAWNILMYGFDWVMRKSLLRQRHTVEEYAEKQARLVLQLVVTQDESNSQHRGARDEAIKGVRRGE